MFAMEMNLSQIAEFVGGRVFGDGTVAIHAVAPFEQATEDQITFADGPKFLKRLEETGAGAVIVPETFEVAGRNLLQAKNPRVAFARTAALLHPTPTPPPGIDERAVIGSNFACGEQVSVAAGVTIGNDVSIGDRSVLRPGVVLEDGVAVGEDVLLHPNVTVYRGCVIGSRVIVHAGSVIGSDGYGFAPEGNRHVKIPQLGIVRIEDDVEIGANCTIDRATFGETRIGQGTKIDNLVQIAHNVSVGEHSLIVAQVGIAGSTRMGKNVILAGHSGVAGHLTLGDHVIVGPMAGVGKSLESGEIVSGAPSMPHRRWLRVQQVVPELPEFKKSLRSMEKRLEQLEKKKSG